MTTKKKIVLAIFGPLIIILIFYALVDFVFFPNRYDPITTKVVDADTGEPIDGAVIMAEWTNTKGIGLTYTVSYKIEEVITDENGMARLEGIPTGKASLYAVAVYKKGYFLWSNKHTFPETQHHTDYKWKDNYIFQLERFVLKDYKPKYPYMKHTEFIGRATGLIKSHKPLISKASYWENLEASKERSRRYRDRRRN